MWPLGALMSVYEEEILDNASGIEVKSNSDSISETDQIRQYPHGWLSPSSQFLHQVSSIGVRNEEIKIPATPENSNTPFVTSIEISPLDLECNNGSPCGSLDAQEAYCRANLVISLQKEIEVLRLRLAAKEMMPMHRHRDVFLGKEQNRLQEWFWGPTPKERERERIEPEIKERVHKERERLQQDWNDHGQKKCERFQQECEAYVQECKEYVKKEYERITRESNELVQKERERLQQECNDKVQKESDRFQQAWNKLVENTVERITREGELRREIQILREGEEQVQKKIVQLHKQLAENQQVQKNSERIVREYLQKGRELI
ncbi:hypothetical protein DFS34DRAFT_165573 [Phlyctochytrium arcticum]|nr:hypothetical protein DFS34DRAFT_165573 [Phlyctochytrium arcticum]